LKSSYHNSSLLVNEYTARKKELSLNFKKNIEKLNHCILFQMTEQDNGQRAEVGNKKPFSRFFKNQIIILSWLVVYQ